jgi:sugar/nucleoside kinase (ribokinase family)
MFDVVTIGTATRDVFLRVSDGKAYCFQEGSKNEVDRPVFATGGGAVNAAVTFARQGLKTATLCRVGNDQPGQDLWEELKRENSHFWKVQDDRHGTGYATILLSPSGERTILAYRGAAESLAHKEVPFTDLKSHWLYIVPSHIDPTLMEKIVEHCFYQGTAIAMNPSKFYLEKGAKNLKPFLDKIKVLLVNREEAAYLTGEDFKNERGIFKKLDELVKGIAVMTDGPRGVWVSDGQKLYQAGIFKERKIVDRTGAGDAFGSGFVAGLMVKDSIEYAIRLASANATSVVEEIGAHTSALTKLQFESERRWPHLEIKVHQL